MTATATKKITVATVKAFMRKRLKAGDLLLSVGSRFDGMYDCVMPTSDPGFTPAYVTRNPDDKNDMGINGVWFTRGSYNSCTAFDDGVYAGYRVWNCCGSWSVAAKK